MIGYPVIIVIARIIVVVVSIVVDTVDIVVVDFEIDIIEASNFIDFHSLNNVNFNFS